MESSRSRNGIGAGRAGAVVAIVAGLVALPPALAGGENPSSGAPPPDADGIAGNEEPAGDSPGDSMPDSDAPAIVAPSENETHASASSIQEQAPEKRGGCPNTTTPVVQLSDAKIRKSTGCLINRERRQRNRGSLSLNGDLGSAAEKHTRVMIRDDCFFHKCPGEPGLGKRIRRTGYLDGARKWRFAENLGCAPTTQSMVAAWMEDTFNRANILNRSYRDLGVGFEQGVPPTPPEDGTCASGAGTFTLVFAFRRG